MTPKEIVQTAFEEDVTPWLYDLGFSYSKSQFTYKRKRDVFVQEIHVFLSYRNTQDSICFHSAFNVGSPKYNPWLKKQQREFFKGYIGGCADWNIPMWRKPDDYSTWLDFSNPQLRPSVIAEWRNRCLTAGFPYLDQISSWTGAAEDLMRWQWHHDQAADFFLIAGDKERAIAAFEAGIARLKSQEIPVSPNAHPILIAKRARQNAKRLAEIGTLEKRLQTIKTGS